MLPRLHPREDIGWCLLSSQDLSHKQHERRHVGGHLCKHSPLVDHGERAGTVMKNEPAFPPRGAHVPSTPNALDSPVHGDPRLPSLALKPPTAAVATVALPLPVDTPTPAR